MRKSFGWCTVRLYAPSRLPFILFGSTTHNSFSILRERQKVEGGSLKNSKAPNEHFTKEDVAGGSGGGERNKIRKEMASSPAMTFQQVVHQLGTSQGTTSFSSSGVQSMQKKKVSSEKRERKTSGFEALLLWCALHQENSLTYPTSPSHASLSSVEVTDLPDGVSISDEKKNNLSTIITARSRQFIKQKKNGNKSMSGSRDLDGSQESKVQETIGESSALLEKSKLLMLSSCREANEAALSWIHENVTTFSCGQSLVLLSLVCDLLYRGLCYLPLFCFTLPLKEGCTTGGVTHLKGHQESPLSFTSHCKNCQNKNGGKDAKEEGKKIHAFSECLLFSSSSKSSSSSSSSCVCSSFSLMDDEYLHEFIWHISDTAQELLRHIQQQPTDKLEAQPLPLVASGLYGVFRVEEKLKQRQVRREKVMVKERKKEQEVLSQQPAAGGSSSSRVLSSTPGVGGNGGSSCFRAHVGEENMMEALQEPLAFLRCIFVPQIRPPSNPYHPLSASPLSTLVVSHPPLAIKVMLVFFLCVPADVRKDILQEKEPAAVRGLSVLLTRALQPWLSLRERKRGGSDYEKEAKAGGSTSFKDGTPGGNHHRDSKDSKAGDGEESREGDPSITAAVPQESGVGEVPKVSSEISLGTLAQGKEDDNNSVEKWKEEKEVDSGEGIEEALHTMDYLEECMMIFYNMRDHSEIRPFLKLCLLEYFLLRIRSPTSYSAEELQLVPLLLRPFRDIHSQYRDNIVKALILSSGLLPEEGGKEQEAGEGRAQSNLLRSESLYLHLPPPTPTTKSMNSFTTLVRLLPFLHFPKDLIERSGVQHWPLCVQAEAVENISAVESAEILRHTASYLPPVVEAQLQCNVLQVCNAAGEMRVHILAERDSIPSVLPSTVSTVLHHHNIPSSGKSNNSGRDDDVDVHKRHTRRRPPLVPLSYALVYALYHFFLSTTSSSRLSSSIVEKVRQRMVRVDDCFTTKRNEKEKNKSELCHKDGKMEVMKEGNSVPHHLQELLLSYCTQLLPVIDWVRGVREAAVLSPPFRFSSSSTSLPPAKDSKVEAHSSPLIQERGTLSEGTMNILPATNTPATLATRLGPSFLLSLVQETSLEEDSFYSYYGSPFSNEEEEAQVRRMALELYLFLRETVLYDHTGRQGTGPPPIIPISVLSDHILLQRYIYPLFQPPCGVGSGGASSSASASYFIHARKCSILSLVSRAVPLLEETSHRVQLIENAIQFNASAASSHSSGKAMKKNGGTHQEVLRFLHFLAPYATTHSMVSTVAVQTLLDPSLESLNPLRSYNRHHWGTGAEGIRGLAKYYTSVMLAACEYCLMIVCSGESYLTPSSLSSSSSSGAGGLHAGKPLAESGKESLPTQLVKGWLEDYFRHMFHLEYQLEESMKQPVTTLSSPTEVSQQQEEEDQDGVIEKGSEEELEGEEEEVEEAEHRNAEWNQPSVLQVLGEGDEIKEENKNFSHQDMEEEREQEDSARETTPSRDRLGEGENELLSMHELHRLLTVAIRLGAHLSSTVYFRLIQQPIERLAVLPPQLAGTSSSSSVFFHASNSTDQRKEGKGVMNEEKNTTNEQKKEVAASGDNLVVGEHESEVVITHSQSPPSCSSSLPSPTKASEELSSSTLPSKHSLTTTLPHPAAFIYYVRSGRLLPFPLTIPYLCYLLESCDIRIIHLSLSAFIIAFNAQFPVDDPHTSSFSASAKTGRRRAGHMHGQDTSSFMAHKNGKVEPHLTSDPNEWKKRCQTAWEVVPCAATRLEKRLLQQLSSYSPSPNPPQLLHHTAKSVAVAHVFRVLLHQLDRVAILMNSFNESFPNSMKSESSNTSSIHNTNVHPAGFAVASPSSSTSAPQPLCTSEREVNNRRGATKVVAEKETKNVIGIEKEGEALLSLFPENPQQQPMQVITPFIIPMKELEEVENVLLRCVKELVDPSHLKKICLTFLNKMHLWFPSVAVLLFQNLTEHEKETLNLKDLFSLSIAYPPSHPYVDSTLEKMDLKKCMEFSELLPQIKQLPMFVIERIVKAHLPNLSFAWCSRLLSSLTPRQGETSPSLLDSILSRLESLVPASSDSDRHLVLMVLQGYLHHHHHSPSAPSLLSLNGTINATGEAEEVHRKEGEERRGKIAANDIQEDGNIHHNVHHKYQRLLQCYISVMKVSSVVDLDSLKEFLRLTPSSLHSHILPTLTKRVQHYVLPPLLAFSSSLSSDHQGKQSTVVEVQAPTGSPVCMSAFSLPLSVIKCPAGAALLPFRSYLQRLLHVTRLLHQEKILDISLRQMILQAIFPLDGLFRQSATMINVLQQQEPPTSQQQEQQGSCAQTTNISTTANAESPSTADGLDGKTRPNTEGLKDTPNASPVVVAPSIPTSSQKETVKESLMTSFSSSPSIDDIVIILAELAILLGDRFVSIPSSFRTSNGTSTATTPTSNTSSSSDTTSLQPPIFIVIENYSTASHSIQHLVMHIANAFPSASERLLLLTTLAELCSSIFGSSTSNSTSSSNGSGSSMTKSLSSSGGTVVGRLFLSGTNRNNNNNNANDHMNHSFSQGSLNGTASGHGGSGVQQGLDHLAQVLLSHQCTELSSSRFVKLVLLVSKTKRWHLLFTPLQEQNQSMARCDLLTNSPFHKVFLRVFVEADAHTRCVLMRALSTDASLLHRYETFMVQPMIDSINVLGYEDLELLLTTMLPMQSMTLVEALLDAVGTRLLALLPTQCRGSTLVRLLQCHAAFQIADDHLLNRVLSTLEEQVSSFGMHESQTSHSMRRGTGNNNGSGSVGGMMNSTSELRLSITQIIHLLQSIVKLDLRAPERLLLACFARVEKVVETLPHYQVLQLTRLAVEVEMEYTPSIHTLVTSLLDHNHRASDYRTTAEERETVELLCDVYDVELPFHGRRAKLRDRRRKHRQMEARFYLEQKKRAEMCIE